MSENNQFPTSRQDTDRVPGYRPDPIKSEMEPVLNTRMAGSSLGQTNPLSGKQITAKPLAPSTVTEALEDLLSRQNEIKAALDVLISDATTLRLQL